jgi:hypothetical protein
MAKVRINYYTYADTGDDIFAEVSLEEGKIFGSYLPFHNEKNMQGENQLIICSNLDCKDNCDGVGKHFKNILKRFSTAAEAIVWAEGLVETLQRENLKYLRRINPLYSKLIPFPKLYLLEEE